MAQLVERPTLDFGSGHDLRVDLLDKPRFGGGYYQHNFTSLGSPVKLLHHLL